MAHARFLTICLSAVKGLLRTRLETSYVNWKDGGEDPGGGGSGRYASGAVKRSRVVSYYKLLQKVADEIAEAEH